MVERKFTVVGKAHRAGVSKKTGKAYDFCSINVVCPPNVNDDAIVGYDVKVVFCTEEFYNEVKPGTVYSDLFKTYDDLVSGGVLYVKKQA